LRARVRVRVRVGVGVGQDRDQPGAPRICRIVSAGLEWRGGEGSGRGVNLVHRVVSGLDRIGLDWIGVDLVPRIVSGEVGWGGEWRGGEGRGVDLVYRIVDESAGSRWRDSMIESSMTLQWQGGDGGRLDRGRSIDGVTAGCGQRGPSAHALLLALRLHSCVRKPPSQGCADLYITHQLQAGGWAAGRHVGALGHRGGGRGRVGRREWRRKRPATGPARLLLCFSTAALHRSSVSRWAGRRA